MHHKQSSSEYQSQVYSGSQFTRMGHRRAYNEKGSNDVMDSASYAYKVLHSKVMLPGMQHRLQVYTFHLGGDCEYIRSYY